MSTIRKLGQFAVGAGLRHASARTERSLQEPAELLVGHPVTLDLQAVFGVPLVVNVVWRVGENEIRSVAGHQLGDIGRICRAAAEAPEPHLHP